MTHFLTRLSLTFSCIILLSSCSFFNGIADWSNENMPTYDKMFGDGPQQPQQQDPAQMRRSANNPYGDAPPASPYGGQPPADPYGMPPAGYAPPDAAAQAPYGGQPAYPAQQGYAPPPDAAAPAPYGNPQGYPAPQGYAPPAGYAPTPDAQAGYAPPPAAPYGGAAPGYPPAQAPAPALSYDNNGVPQVPAPPPWPGR